MKKKILISGSSGQVGSSLLEYLLSKYEVIGIDIKKSNIDAVKKATIIGDIKDKDFIDKVVKDVNIIIHTAAQLDIKKSIENPVFDAELNIIGTLNLLEAARKNKNFSKFIYFSTSSVYGNYRYLPIDEKHPLKPISPYGLSKMTAEKYCFMYHDLFDLPIVILRPFNIYSNREDTSKKFVSLIYRFCNNIKSNRKIKIHGDGTQKRDFIHVRDVIAFIDKIISNEKTNGEIFNIASGKPLSILDIALLVLKLGQKEKDTCLEFINKTEGKIDHSYADIKKAKKYGFSPKISIEEGIKEILSE